MDPTAIPVILIVPPIIRRTHDRMAFPHTHTGQLVAPVMACSHAVSPDIGREWRKKEPERGGVFPSAALAGTLRSAVRGAGGRAWRDPQTPVRVCK